MKTPGVKYVQLTISIHGLNAPSLDGLEQLVREACRSVLVTQDNQYNFRDEFDTDIEVEIQEIAGAPHLNATKDNMTNDQSVQLIKDELARAEAKHPQWDGRRHGQSVIEEEYIEFRNALFADDFDHAFAEVTQLGAMCARYIKNHAPDSVRMSH